MGYCTGNPVPGYASSPRGGAGFGGGGRHGYRNMFYATGLYGWQRAAVHPLAPVTVSKEQEIEALKRQADYFGDQLEAIRRRLKELEKEE